MNQAEYNTKRLKEELQKRGSHLLRTFPIEVYLDDVLSYPLLHNYTYLSPELKEIFHKVTSDHDSHTLALYHKLALSSFVEKGTKSIESGNLPHDVLDLYNQYFNRVLNDLSTQPDNYYSHENDSFLKDLAVCSLRAIPVSRTWIAEVSGISRRFLISGGIAQTVDSLKFLLFKMRGLKPFYQIHVVMRHIDGFSPQGRDQCYRNLAELLRVNPGIKGMFAGSWYYDPVLQHISPRLLYLRQKPEQHGAKVFRLGTSQADIHNAIAKSQTRKRLYQQGKYTPTGYIQIWPRKELIGWADHERTISNPQ